MRATKTHDHDRTRLEVALRALLEFLERCGSELRDAPTRRRERLERALEALPRPAAEESDRRSRKPTH